jgi:uncharacterized protein (TIGR02145 family)
MAENLNYAVEGSKCYNNSESNCNEYGHLYNCATAMNLPSRCNSSTCSGQIQSPHRGSCPSGWHIPSQAEWNVLGDDARKLKATSGWNSNGNGTDDYGFSALPGGNGFSGGSFYNVGYGGNWWSASEDNSDYAYRRYMYYGHDHANCYGNNKYGLFSVRCVQD